MATPVLGIKWSFRNHYFSFNSWFLLCQGINIIIWLNLILGPYIILYNVACKNFDLNLQRILLSCKILDIAVVLVLLYRQTLPSCKKFSNFYPCYIFWLGMLYSIKNMIIYYIFNFATLRFLLWIYQGIYKWKSRILHAHQILLSII